MEMQFVVVSKDRTKAYHIGKMVLEQRENIKDYPTLKFCIRNAVADRSWPEEKVDDLNAEVDGLASALWTQIGIPFDVVMEDQPLFPEFINALIVGGGSLFVGRHLGDVFHRRAEDRRSYLGADEP